ncbi:hypothetical protein ONB66_00760 [Candidatus Vidania fulgoroideae]|uniref:30S ribosomal protein S16 n=1 Tax=Candidatus Vidania fulgoroideorum TaxID=881286 RepID=A0AAX3NBM1_9PROT|nr:hypothetical protein ONB67_00135 [Candidatus Vidania fulgoroideae]WDR79373.1 hypothetical protein ONB66_00760 [Candidatus Vidania fulgoroideae]
MYKIVLKRIGRKKVNCFKIIARNSNKKNKKKILYLGYYNNSNFDIDKKKVIEIIKNGGKTSNIVKKILKQYDKERK